MRFIEPRVRPIARATDLGSVQVLKHGNVFLLTDQFGDIHPDSRGLGPVPDGHAAAVVLGAARRRRAAGPPPGLDGRQLPRRDPADQPDRRPQPGHEGPPARRPRRADDRDRPRPADRRRRPRGAGPHREPRGARGHDHGRARAGPDDADIFEVRGYPRRRAGRSCRWRSRRSGRRSATTASTASGARTYLAFSAAGDRDRRGRPRCRPIRSTPGPRSGCAGAWPSSRGRRRAALDRLGDTMRPMPPDAAADSPTRRRSSRSRRSSRATKAPRRTAPGTTAPRRSTPTTSCSTCVDGALVHDLRLLVNEARARTSAISRPACRGSRRCSGGTRSSPRSSRSRSGRRSPSRRWPCWRPTRRPRSTTGATRSPARSSTSCGPARWPAPASCRTRPYYGSVDSTPLWLILLGETFDWTGDRGRARPPVAERAGRARLDRHVRRPRRRRVRRIRAPLRARPAQPGLEGLQRRDPRPARRRSRVPPIALAEVQGYVFDAKRRMAALARVRGDDELAARLDADAETLRRALRGRVLDRGPALLRDGPRPRQAPGRRDRLECRPVPVDGDRQPGARARRRRAAARPGDVLGLGDPDLRARPARLQPDRLSHRLGLAARHVADRGRDEALRVRRRGQPRGRPRPRGGPAVRRVPAARALLRLRPRARARSRSRTRSRARRRRGRRRRRSCS